MNNGVKARLVVRIGGVYPNLDLRSLVMNDILLKISLWAGVLVVVFLIVRKPLVRWIKNKTKEFTRLPPMYISTELKESLNRGRGGYIAPEVYTALTFWIPELLKLVKNPNHPI